MCKQNCEEQNIYMSFHLLQKEQNHICWESGFYTNTEKHSFLNSVRISDHFISPLPNILQCSRILFCNEVETYSVAN